MNGSPEPDSFERRLRFVCGFIAGGVTALLLVAEEVAAMTGAAWATVVIIALIAGYLAMRFGHDFWRVWFR